LKTGFTLFATPSQATYRKCDFLRRSDLIEDIVVDHSSFVSVEKRELTSREAELTEALTTSNSEWASLDVKTLRVIGECRCGCQSVVFEKPREPQNARAVGHQNLVGEMSVSIKTQGTDDIISVLLHFAEGSLSLLEIVWYNFPEPIPENWTEVGREVFPR
jgi:hypothetical protein